ncbi:MAG: hypothetical protein R3C53_28890 [Pirellulaceae bacterium]
MNVDSALAELLAIAKRIGAGNVPRYQHSETFTVGAFDMVFTNLRDVDAFRLLSHACQQYDSIKTDAATLTGFIYLISDLARKSATTEMPPGMQQIVLDNPTQTSELREWYRMDSNV